MSQADGRTVFVYCETCKKNVPLAIPTGKDSKRTGGLLSIVSIHGAPIHAVVAYVDAMLRVRGIEYPETSMADDLASRVSEKTLERLESEAAFDLSDVLGLLNERQKDAIKVLGLMLTQAVTGRQVVCVHSERDTARGLVDMIRQLFSGQSVNIIPASHKEMEGQVLKDICVFDMVSRRFIAEGPRTDTSYLSKVIEDVLAGENAYAQLKSEVSRILYAYENMKQILTSTDKPITDTRLATEVSIDLSLVPVLLDIAEGQGLKLRDKVLRNGLGRAIRSI
ncbi:MAG: hypothetical protein QXS20_04925 [Candidatus Thorarchaeota archaeon]